MNIIVADDLWSSSMLPEGLVERWRVADGSLVKPGDCIAEVRIEDALHEIVAPVGGRLTVAVAANDVVEPGSVLGRVDA